MDEKFRQGLANRVKELHESVLSLREEFINCKADEDYITDTEALLDPLMGMYLDLTRPVKD